MKQHSLIYSRDEHDDLLLYEVLLCLKGLCTTQAGLEKLAIVASSVFPNLLKMIFDDDRKGPSEFKTRGVVINLMCKTVNYTRRTFTDYYSCSSCIDPD